MTYSKPEVEVLGDASVVIMGGKSDQRTDGQLPSNDGAYELDE